MHDQERLSRRAFLRSGAWAAIGLAAGCVGPAIHETALPTVPAAATSLPTDAPTSTATTETIPSPTPTTEPTATLAPPAAVAPTPNVTPQPTSTVGQQVIVTPEATDTVVATNTVVPTATPLAARSVREDLIAHYPQAAQSAVAIVQHDGVWSGDEIEPNAVLQMLDAAITQLTGLGDALAAWRTLFDPGETIGIKVNTISRYTTTPQVAHAVAQRLQDAGIPADQIVIFDRTDQELLDRGFTLNPEGPGVRCRGAQSWEEPATVAGTTQRIHDVMLSCDALINIPTLKEHSMSGFTSALKNHYGTMHDPEQMHGNDCDPYIAELNALPIIRHKTRLIVGDFVRICPYDWNQMTRESKIAMSFDSVAHDWVARQVLLDRREADGRPAKYIEGRSHYMDTAVDMGLGANADHIEVRRSTLG